MAIFLGIDIGTTAVKFKVYENRMPKISFDLPVETYYDQNAVYQKPEEILELIKEGIKSVIQKVNHINQISFSTAMHTLIPRVKENEDLRMYIWSDNQASKVITEFKKTKLAEQFYNKTGTPIHAMTPFAKLLFFKHSQFDFFQKVYQWQDLKAYIFSELTGNNVTDYSNATATGLFNSLTFEWDREILKFLRLDKEKLPQCSVPKTSFDLLPKSIEELKINASVELIIGASDGCLAALAACKRTGQKLTLTLGTSGAVRKIANERELNYQSNQFCYYISDNLWVVGGATNNGGKVLEWLQQSFYNNQVDVYSILASELTHINYRKPLPIFLPYIQGERAPIWNSEATGELVGLSINHHQRHIILSVAESILYNLKKISDMLCFREKKPILVLSGGFFKTSELIQLTADIFNMDVCLSEDSEPIDGLLLLSYNMSHSIKDVSVVKPASNTEQQFYYESRYKLFINQLEKITLLPT